MAVNQRPQKNSPLSKVLTKNHSVFEQRKKAHIDLSLDDRTQNITPTDFDSIRLIHESLPEINLSEVSLQTQLLGQRVSSPHFISSMTAGSPDSTAINLRLATGAAENNWLMAVGSQRRELTDQNAAQEWKTIRTKVPKAKFISNIGLEELITYTNQKSIDQILKLTDSIEALGIYIHLNPLQEAFQKQDQAFFKNGLKAIEKLCAKSSVPVLVKEVGFGISKNTAQKLFKAGVSIVDVSGKGGTHWGRLEGLRDQSQDQILANASLAFKDWGYSTVESLLDCQSLVHKKSIWASGGIRNGVDSVKCLALGAKAVGIAQPLMKAAILSDKDVIKVMNRFDYELKVAMFGLGISNIQSLAHPKTLKKVLYVKRSI